MSSEKGVSSDGHKELEISNTVSKLEKKEEKFSKNEYYSSSRFLVGRLVKGKWCLVQCLELIRPLASTGWPE